MSSFTKSEKVYFFVVNLFKIYMHVSIKPNYFVWVFLKLQGETVER